MDVGLCRWVDSVKEVTSDNWRWLVVLVGWVVVSYDVAATAGTIAIVPSDMGNSNQIQVENGRFESDHQVLGSWFAFL